MHRCCTFSPKVKIEVGRNQDLKTLQVQNFKNYAYTISSVAKLWPKISNNLIEAIVSKNFDIKLHRWKIYKAIIIYDSYLFAYLPCEVYKHQTLHFCFVLCCLTHTHVEKVTCLKAIHVQAILDFELWYWRWVDGVVH